MTMKETRKSYKEKLLDPRWQKKRLEIMKRDGFACRLCRTTEKTLHVHHIHYDSNAEGPWDYFDTSLVTLCCDCHEFETGQLVIDRNYFITRVAGAGVWLSAQFALLGDAFSTDEPMDEFELEAFARAIMLLTQSRRAHLAKKRGDPDAETFTTEGAWVQAMKWNE